MPETNFRGRFVKDPETREWYFIPVEKHARFVELTTALGNDLPVDELEEIFAYFTAEFGPYETKHPVHYALENLEELQ